MRVLWIVNKIFPYPAKVLRIKESVFGGWLQSLAYNLEDEENIELGIATVYYGKEIKIIQDEKIKYYLLPGAPALKYNQKLEQYWKYVQNDFKAEIVHIHGTEYAHGLAFMRVYPNVKTVISIQGLVSACEKVYYGNIGIKDIIKNITIRDIIKKDNIFEQKNKFKIRGQNEVEMLKRAKAVIGRTTWDFANTKAINPKLKYYTGNETIRGLFYKNKWNPNSIEKDIIFCSQAGYPIKGFHYLLEALYILEKSRPNIKLYVAGNNILDNKTIKQKIKRTGYAKYIYSLIEKYNLQKQIIFLGMLEENEMIDRLLKSNVFVLPSVIENSSNSLAEAMLLGMPCVATNTGGTMDILEHKKEGFLYPYTEPAICAEYINKFLNDEKLCIEYGTNARNKALIRHKQDKNVQDILSIYQDIMKG